MFYNARPTLEFSYKFSAPPTPACAILRLKIFDLYGENVY